MKIKLLFILILSVSTMSAQKVVKKIAEGTCECLEEKLKEDPELDISAAVEECIQWVVNKSEKEIKKELGNEFFENATTEESEQFGIKIGQVLLSDCDAFSQAIMAYSNSETNKATTYFEQGQQKANDGDYEAAIELYTKAIENNNEEFGYFNLRGVAQYNLGNYYRAISDFYRASETDPENHLGSYNAAFAIYQLGDYKSALKEANIASGINKYYCNAYNLKGLIYNKLEQPDSALLYYNLAYECDDSNLNYLYNIGYTQYKMKDYVGASNSLSTAEERAYHTYDLYLYLGNAYNSIGEYEKALSCQTTMIDSFEVGYVPFFNRGLSHFNLERYDAALKDFQKAYELDSSDLDIAKQLIKVNNAIDRYDESLKWCEHLLKDNYGNADYYDLRAEVYHKKKDYKLAIADYEMSLTLYPNDCNIHLKLADLYKLIKQNSKGNYHLEKAKEMGCDL